MINPTGTLPHLFERRGTIRRESPRTDGAPPTLDRRQTVRNWTPSEKPKPSVTHSYDWTRFALSLAVAGLVVLSAKTIFHTPTPPISSILLPVTPPTVFPIYRWQGYHRVAP
jgi:hypothetical protein